MSNRLRKNYMPLYLAAFAGLSRCKRDSIPVFWVTLSSPVGSDQSLLPDQHRELVRRLPDAFGVSPLYLAVRTGESNGVIHALWFFKSHIGRSLYLPGRELTAMWTEINGGLSSRFLRGDFVKYRPGQLAQYFADQKWFIRSFQSTAYWREFGPESDVIAA